jgi:hypothetical protein
MESSSSSSSTTTSTPPKHKAIVDYHFSEKENMIQASTMPLSPGILPYPTTATPFSTPMALDSSPSNMPNVRKRLQDISLISSSTCGGGGGSNTGNGGIEESKRKGHRTTRAVGSLYLSNYDSGISWKESREWRDQDPVATTLLQEQGKGDGIVHMIGTLTDTAGLIRPVATRWKR